MPLVGFRPTKARLVIEDTRDSVLVMRCVIDPDDGVELASGGTLESLSGVLRIRERSGANGNGRDKGLGTLTFVPESDSGGDGSAARFQVSVHLSVERFGTVMRAINAGHLPAKFFVDVGARGDRKELPGFSFRSRGGLRIKHWDNVEHRVLPVSSCVMIMALDAPLVQAAGAPLTSEAGVIAASNAHVAELVDDLLVFQADTRTTMMGFAAVLGVVAAAALAIALVMLIR